MHAVRRKGRARSRILYWFRTPPGVKVGRTPLDAEALRQIEASHPDLEFDWSRILKGQGDPESPADERRREGREREPRPNQAGAQGRSPEAAPVQARRAEAAPAEPPVAAVQPSAEEEVPDTAVYRKLGAAAVKRLRTRYLELAGRIGERIADPDAQTELKTLAERLNPDGWETDEQVAAGLDGYEETLETLRTSLNPRRPREERAAEAPPATPAPEEPSAE